MATRNIPIKLPDGQEDELIEEFATYEGWTVESGVSAASIAVKATAYMFKERIKQGRVQAAMSTARIEKEQEVEALNIS